MIGIYCITNNITGECYIGQSKDIDNRFKEHIWHKNKKIGRLIEEYGIDNFTFEVLEECAVEQLDELERYYIEQYGSNYPGLGYNIKSGGQSCEGATNANSKLDQFDVYIIRNAYNNHERKSEVYERFKNKITESYFSNVWEGISWPNIMPWVYTEENKRFYMSETSKGENGAFAKFTNDEVLELRKRYVNESAKQIYESVKDRCTYSTLQAILWGRSYKDVPLYSKQKKKWIS